MIARNGEKCKIAAGTLIAERPHRTGRARLRHPASHLGYLTAKRARGHGGRMRGVGSHRSRIERLVASVAGGRRRPSRSALIVKHEK